MKKLKKKLYRYEILLRGIRMIYTLESENKFIHSSTTTTKPDEWKLFCQFFFFVWLEEKKWKNLFHLGDDDDDYDNRFFSIVSFAETKNENENEK